MSVVLVTSIAYKTINSTTSKMNEWFLHSGQRKKHTYAIELGGSVHLPLDLGKRQDVQSYRHTDRATS